MSAQADNRLQVDAPRLVREQATLQGKFAAHELPRLTEYLHSGEGGVEYRISGARDTRQRPLIRCIINGYFDLVCQRCLGPLRFELGTDQQLLVVPSESALPAPDEEEDDVDCIVAAPKFDVLALVEDEIILNLPLAPRHAEGACSSALGGATTQDNEGE